jgi:tRNA-specific 2-thiouridylase
VRAGYEVEAAFMKNWSSTTGLVDAACPWLDDRREALKVAAHLGIPMHTFDFEAEFSELVMDQFFKAYAAGRTPNPDVACNREIKFRLLYDEAMRRGFDFLATGHYAQAVRGELVRSRDEFKDQTYFMYTLRGDQLSHLMFPVGCYLKPEVRELAKKLGMPNAARKESMGICFVGNVKLVEFLRQRVPVKEGAIVDASGRVLGQHRGVQSYTLGQRDGLNIGGTGPYYVVQKNLESNTLVVSKKFDDSALMSRELDVEDVNWITSPAELPLRCTGRFRHQQELQDLSVEKISGKHGAYHVTFDHPQRAAAPGQSLVLYKGRVCLGGGVIV